MLKELTSKKLKFLRKLKRETQASLAEKVGVNYRHLQKLESGEVDIKISTLEKLSSVLKVPSCYLIESNDGHALESIKLPCPAALLDALHIGIAVLDLNGLIVYCNENYAQMLERRKDDIISKIHMHDLVEDPAQAEAVKRYTQEIRDKRPEPVPYRRRQKAKNGEEFNIISNWNYLYDHENRVIGVLCVVSKEDLQAKTVDYVSPERLAAN